MELPAAFAVEQMAAATPCVACAIDATFVVDSRGLTTDAKGPAPPGVDPAVRSTVRLL